MHLLIASDGSELAVRAAQRGLELLGRPERLTLLSVVSHMPTMDTSGVEGVMYSPETDQALLRVEDTGVGIPAEHLDSIFELFAQAPMTLDRARGGMGLGLTLVRALVQLQGGTVGARSRGVGQGSCFEVRLPRLEGAAATDKQAPGIEVEPRLASPALRIVVVDDNVDVRETLVELLALEGYAVEEAADGPQGLTRILSTRPDVALVDIGLPGFDGYELARRARRTLGDSLLLIAMTGYGQAEDNRRAFEAGFDSHITKPVSIEIIEAALSRGHAPETAPLS